ncbi:hypothetical protein K7X08_004548 [Anisodus acutangulus]|uniref:Uncharacterized protein n=1 Tax=Anisodus acutangulus TaxID=402998 RepID=A0A9Q1MDL6_9SOLA|nr:hypothetical protein K7X08_004548 [Anisodus acutangulus]
MARFIAQALNLIRTTAAPSSRRNAILLIASKSESTQPDRNVGSNSSEAEEAEALAVQRIEETIHRIIVRRSAPDWLPFCPGASYWVPPRRSSYGIADVVHKMEKATAFLLPLLRFKNFCTYVAEEEAFPSWNLYIQASCHISFIY